MRLREKGLQIKEIVKVFEKKGITISQYLVSSTLAKRGMSRGYLGKLKRKELEMKNEEGLILKDEIIELIESGYSLMGIMAILKDRGIETSYYFIRKVLRDSGIQKGSFEGDFDARSKSEEAERSPIFKKGSTWDGMTLEDIDKLRTSGLRNPKRWEDDYF